MSETNEYKVWAGPTVPEGTAPEGGDDVEALVGILRATAAGIRELRCQPATKSVEARKDALRRYQRFAAMLKRAQTAEAEVASLRRDLDEARRERDRMKLLLSWNNTAHEHHPDGDFRSPTVQALTREALSPSTESEASARKYVDGLQRRVDADFAAETGGGNGEHTDG